MLKKFLSLLLSLPLFAAAQDIDVQHYSFSLHLYDSTDRIEGAATISIRFPGRNRSFSLDLVGKKPNGKGMTVETLKSNQVESWKQEGDRIVVQLREGIKSEETYQFQVAYSGVPSDGLIISKNKYGDRTFFADNWPNRAHHWIPCNDRPDDKATFAFVVFAPQGYQVVSNGNAAVYTSTGQDQSRPQPGMPTAVWAENVPSPTKVMVIGVARFAVRRFDDSPSSVPVSAWVYPQDSTKGFYDYGVTPTILKFFTNYIAPFPYEKLANVQSKTIFGGMENASAIFYAEESVTGDRKWEDVFAHEIAHQWFGDMASEKSFAHLWLSEGFATYFTNLYIEQMYGVDSMRSRLRADRQQVIDFPYGWKHAVVDTTKDLMALLNANSYQKGGWVLHMLRQEVGDAVFRRIIQTYYNTYKGSNADTRDFQRVVENVTGKSWSEFFDQWLYRPGIPKLMTSTTFTQNKVSIHFWQKQAGAHYRINMEILLRYASGKEERHSFTFAGADAQASFDLSGKEKVQVILDPDAKLLFQQVK